MLGGDPDESTDRIDTRAVRGGSRTGVVLIAIAVAGIVAAGLWWLS